MSQTLLQVIKEESIGKYKIKFIKFLNKLQIFPIIKIFKLYEKTPRNGFNFFPLEFSGMLAINTT